MKQSYPIHAQHLRAVTDNLLCHQRLGQPCYQYLCNDHKYIDRVSKCNYNNYKVLNQCPICIQANISKPPPGHGTTRVATKPYQGLLIDSELSGMNYYDSDQKTIYEGINGENCCILTTDHFTGIKNGDARISKASPNDCIRNVLHHDSPTYNNKYIHLYKGGELLNNKYVNNLLQPFGYTLNPTVADTNHKNGPVEQAHRKLADSIKCMLTGSNLYIRFYPYELYHDVRLSNSFP